MVALQKRRSPRTYPMGPPAEDVPSPRICDIAGKRDEADQRTPQSWWPDVVLLSALGILLWALWVWRNG